VDRGKDLWNKWVSSLGSRVKVAFIMHPSCYRFCGSETERIDPENTNKGVLSQEY